MEMGGEQFSVNKASLSRLTADVSAKAVSLSGFLVEIDERPLFRTAVRDTSFRNNPKETNFVLSIGVFNSQGNVPFVGLNSRAGSMESHCSTAKANIGFMPSRSFICSR